MPVKEYGKECDIDELNQKIPKMTKSRASKMTKRKPGYFKINSAGQIEIFGAPFRSVPFQGEKTQPVPFRSVPRGKKHTPFRSGTEERRSGTSFRNGTVSICPALVSNKVGSLF